MYTVIQTERGASDMLVELGVFDTCGLDVQFIRYELEGEDALIEACAGSRRPHLRLRAAHRPRP